MNVFDKIASASKISLGGKGQTKKWKTKSGQKIRVCDITDSHLLRAIEAIEHYRTNQAMGLLDAAELFGPDSEASWQLEQAGTNILEETEEAEDYPDIYYDMVEEAEQRGLRDE